MRRNDIVRRVVRVVNVRWMREVREVRSMRGMRRTDLHRTPSPPHPHNHTYALQYENTRPPPFLISMPMVRWRKKGTNAQLCLIVILLPADKDFRMDQLPLKQKRSRA